MNTYLQEKESRLFSQQALLMTGASSALGQGIVSALVSTPLSFILQYHMHTPETPSSNHTVCLPCDFNLKEDISHFTATLKQHPKPLYFIHCAGNISFHSAATMNTQAFSEILNVHVHAVLPILKTILPFMLKQKRGHVIFIGSMQAMKGSPFAAHYASAKSALIGLCKSVAKEYGTKGVQCNVVLPGYFPSPLSKKNVDRFEMQIQHENVLAQKHTVLEVAHFVRHLLSMENVSGQVFNLDSRILP